LLAVRYLPCESKAVAVDADVPLVLGVMAARVKPTVLGLAHEGVLCPKSQQVQNLNRLGSINTQKPGF
jgi:hypothetical protein